jgi:hypothetical protein
MSFHRNRKLSPFSHLEKSPLLDKLYNITRPAEPPPQPEAEEPAAPSATPLVFGSGLAGEELVAEPAVEEAPPEVEPET